MKYRQLSVLICNVWLTQQTISGGGPHVRAHPCGHRTREDSFRLLYNVHFTSQAATQVSHIFHFLSFFWKKKKKKKKKSTLFLFLFFHHAPILLQKNLSTGANVNFNLSPMFFIVLNIIKLNVYEEIFMDPQEGWIIWLFFDIACIQINKDFKRIEEYYVKKICYIKSIGTMLLLSTYFTNFCLGWHPIYKSQSSIIN